MSRFDKEHRRTLTAMHNGLELVPMGSAGKSFEDGFYLRGEENGIVSFSEVLSSSVIFLENRGYLLCSPKTLKYVVTHEGLIKIGAVKRKKRGSK